MPRTHQEIDERSLALHARVAERLRQNRELLSIARNNLQRWGEHNHLGNPDRPALLEWRQLLDSLMLERE